MKVKYICMLTALLISGCSSITMKRTVNDVSEEYLKKKAGTYSIMVIHVDESYLNYIKASDRQSQMGSNKTSARLQSLKYHKNQYFMFEIRHLDVIEIKKGTFNFSLKDAKGREQVDEIFYFEKLFSDTVLGDSWIIKAKKPVTADNFTKDEIPFTFSISFLNQKIEYEISPR